MSAVETFCVCGHAFSLHEHYRKGTDCAFCGCEEFEEEPS